MYNRYIPQADGSYRRNRIPEPERPKPQPPQDPPRPPAFSKEPECPPCQNCEHAHTNPRPPRPRPSRPNPAPATTGIGQFFRQLLPKDFDTEDLLIVLLLLLMAGDCQEDQNSALLTLALYLFL